MEKSSPDSSMAKVPLPPDLLSELAANFTYSACSSEQEAIVKFNSDLASIKEDFASHAPSVSAVQEIEAMLLQQLYRSFPAVRKYLELVLESAARSATPTDREAAIKALRERVWKDRELSLPSCVEAWFGQLLAASVDANNRHIPRQPKDWPELCRRWLAKLQFEHILPFDSSLLPRLYDPSRLANLYLGIAYVFSYVEGPHDAAESALWTGIVHRMLTRQLPESLQGAAEEIDLDLAAGEECKKSYRAGKRKEGCAAVWASLEECQGEEDPFFVFSLFVATSPFYRRPHAGAAKVSEEAGFEYCEYSPVWRHGIRQFLGCLNSSNPARASTMNLAAKFLCFEACVAEFMEHNKLYGAKSKGSVPRWKQDELDRKEPLVQLMEEMHPDLQLGNSIFMSEDNYESLIAETRMFGITNLDEKRCSPHEVFCFSGFLSETDNYAKSWSSLLAYNRTEMIKAIMWPAGTSWLYNMYRSEGALKYFAAAAALVFTLGGAYTKAKAHFVTKFNEAEKHAEETGKLMATILAKRINCGPRCVSLVAFSLGTVALLSCLKELHRIQKESTPRVIIEDVLLLGGAAVIRPEEIENLREILTVVHGRVVNCYNLRDEMLEHVTKLRGEKPIGIRKIEILPQALVDTEYAVLKSRVRVENFDVTGLIKSHMEYRNTLKEIMGAVSFLNF